MLVPIIMAIWFGIAAKRSGRNVALWALAGGVLALGVANLIHLVGAGLFGPFRYDSYYLTFRIVTMLISIGVTILVGNVITSRFPPGRSGAEESLSGEQVLPPPLEEYIAAPTSPLALLGRIREPVLLLRSGPWPLLLVFPACFLVGAVVNHVYAHFIYGADIIPSSWTILILAGAALFRGTCIALLLAFLRQPVGVVLAWGVATTLQLLGVEYLLAPEFFFQDEEREIIRLLLILLIGMLYAGLFLGLARRWGIRWWLPPLIGLACSLASSTAFQLVFSSSFKVSNLFVSTGYGLISGFILFLAFFVYGSILLALSGEGSPISLSTSPRPRPTSSPRPAGPAVIQAFLVSCTVLLYMAIHKEGHLKGPVFELAIPPLIWFLAMLRVGILHAIVAGLAGMGCLFLFVRYAVQFIYREQGRHAAENSIFLWIIVYAAVLALWAYLARRRVVPKEE